MLGDTCSCAGSSPGPCAGPGPGPGPGPTFIPGPGPRLAPAAPSPSLTHVSSGPSASAPPAPGRLAQANTGSADWLSRGQWRGCCRWAGAARACPHRAGLRPLPPQRSSLLSQPGHWACGETAFEKGPFTWSCSLSSARCLQSSAVPRSAHGVWACSGTEGKGNRLKGRGHDRKGGDRRGAALDLLWISKSFPKCGSVCAASHSPGQEELRDRSRRCQPG